MEKRSLEKGAFASANPIMRDSFKHVCEEFDSALHGRGVRACRPIPKGEIIFYEKPFHILQTLPNRQHVLSCASCCRTLGPLRLHLSILQRRVNRQNVLDELGSIAPLIGEESKIMGTRSKSIVPCSYNCGEYYCSESCKDRHWQGEAHCLLCTGKISDSEAEAHPLMKFKIHAVSTNEIFLLVAEVFASISLQLDGLLQNGHTLDQSLHMIDDPFHGYVRNLWWDAAKCPRGLNSLLFKKSLKRLVSESWALLNDVLQLQVKGYDRLLNEEYMSRTIGMFEQNNVGVQLPTPLAEYANALLPQQHITERNETEPVVATHSFAFDSETRAAAVSELFDATEEIIEVLEADDDGMCCPIVGDDDEEEVDDAEDVDNSNDENPEVAMMKTEDQVGGEIEELLSEHFEGYGINSLYPPFDGTAFYLLICRINHSCDPNMMVKYCCIDEDLGAASISGDSRCPIKTDNGAAGGLRAFVVALRDIAAGEELLQSYIDQFEPYEARQEALVDYGFTCSCKKCIEEATATTV